MDIIKRGNKRLFWILLALAVAVSSPLAAQKSGSNRTDAPATSGPPPINTPPQQDLAVYVAVANTPTGPFNIQQISAKIQGGEVGPDTMVWIEGMAAWAPASTVAMLQPLLGAVPPKLDENPALFLHGSWQMNKPISVPNTGSGDVTLNTTFRPDGTMEIYQWVTIYGTGGRITATTTGEGKFTVEKAGPSVLIVKPNLELMTTVEYESGKLSHDSKPRRYTIIDDNTIVDEDGAQHSRVGS